jgi:ribose transport system substrate-binding protein
MSSSRRRLVLPVVALAASLSLAVTAGGAGAKTASAAKKNVSVSFVYSDYTQDPMQEMALGAAAAGKYYSTGVKFSEVGTNGVNGPVEVGNFQAAEKTSPDGVALEDLTPTEFTRPLQQAVAAKIPVVAVDTPPPAGSGVTAFVGNSNTQLGQELATALLPSIPKNKSGYIIIGQDIPGLSVLMQRINGMIKVFHAQRPKVQIIQFNSTQTISGNYSAWAAELKAHPNPLACMGPGNADAISVSEVEQHTGKHYVVGQADLAPQALQGVKTGLVTALVSPEHWLKGYIAEALLIKHAQTGAPLPKGWWNPGLLLVTKKNVNQIIARQKNNTTRYQWFKSEVNYELAHPSKYLKPIKDAN